MKTCLRIFTLAIAATLLVAGSAQARRPSHRTGRHGTYLNARIVQRYFSRRSAPRAKGYLRAVRRRPRTSVWWYRRDRQSSVRMGTTGNPYFDAPVRDPGPYPNRRDLRRRDYFSAENATRCFNSRDESVTFRPSHARPGDDFNQHTRRLGR